MRRLTLWGLLLGLLVLTGCGTAQSVKEWAVGPRREEAPQLKETRWVLIRNPRFEASMAEPEYVWVEEDKIPKTISTIIFGKNSVLAPAHVVTQYGSPPGGGRISPLQYASAQPAGEATSPKPTLARAATKPEKAPVQEVTPRGYIVHIQKRLIVVDLTSADGVKPGSILSLRRERIRLTHPVSGEYLGELDEEIGTARVVELRERFTLAEIQETRPGVELKVKDRVVLKPE